MYILNQTEHIEALRQHEIKDDGGWICTRAQVRRAPQIKKQN
jgi:hypothetical protein